MINGIFKIFVFSIVSLILIAYLKISKSSFGVYVSIATVVIITVFCLNHSVPIIEFIKTVTEFSNIDNLYLSIVLKALAISFLCEFSCALCQQSGESALCQSVLVASKISILVISMPLYNELFEMVTELWKGA